LTEVQQADMVAAALLAFDGCAVELAAHALLDERFRREPMTGPQMRCDVDSDAPMSASDERALDAMGDERAWR
jgi:hypothetical protein